MSQAELLEGRLASGELPSLLLTLVRRLAVGRLEVDGAEARRQLWLDAGHIRAVVSEVEDEKLGKWLVARGLLEPHRMALSLLAQPEGVRFGALLVQQGALSPGQLASELEQLAVVIVSRLLQAAGSFRFLAGETLPTDAATLTLTTASLLAAAVRAVEDASQLEALLPGDCPVRAVAEGPLHQQPARLLPQEAFLLSRVEGATTVAGLRRLMPLPEQEMTRSLAVLWAVGLVELQREPTTRLAPEPVGEAAAPSTAPPAAQATSSQQAEADEIVRLAGEYRQRDYYRRLSLTRGVTQDQIHGRYKEFSRLYSPDRARESHLKGLRRELSEVHACLTEAYLVLIDHERRVQYDAELRQQSESFASKSDEQRRDAARRELVAANLARAQALIRVGDVGQAVELLDRVVRIDPQGETLLTLARLELRNPMWTQRALEHLRQAVAQSPQLTEAWLDLAGFWERRGQPDKQRQCLERILTYDPECAEARAGLRAMARKR